jgi:hypothetical protein
VAGTIHDESLLGYDVPQPGRETLPLKYRENLWAQIYLAPVAYTISCLTISDKHDFLSLTALNRGAYYAPRVGKSGQKWAFLSSLCQMIKVLLKGLSIPGHGPFAETLCCEEITLRGLIPKGG